nr:hypothetical protein Iba_chr15eCG6560 [Ipomoea batatas]GMD99724.1 hypothetical protein Iba_chr15eCG6570 [Ipomoea batatas]
MLEQREDRCTKYAHNSLDPSLSGEQHTINERISSKSSFSRATQTDSTTLSPAQYVVVNIPRVGGLQTRRYVVSLWHGAKRRILPKCPQLHHSEIHTNSCRRIRQKINRDILPITFQRYASKSLGPWGTTRKRARRGAAAQSTGAELRMRRKMKKVMPGGNTKLCPKRPPTFYSSVGGVSQPYLRPQQEALRYLPLTLAEGSHPQLRSLQRTTVILIMTRQNFCIQLGQLGQRLL